MENLKDINMSLSAFFESEGKWRKSSDNIKESYQAAIKHNAATKFVRINFDDVFPKISISNTLKYLL